MHEPKALWKNLPDKTAAKPNTMSAPKLRVRAAR